MRIVLDAMGSDNYPNPEVQAAVQAGKQFGDQVLLVGQEDLLKSKLDALGGSELVKIIHAADVLCIE